MHSSQSTSGGAMRMTWMEHQNKSSGTDSMSLSIDHLGGGRVTLFMEWEELRQLKSYIVNLLDEHAPARQIPSAPVIPDTEVPGPWANSGDAVEA